MGQSFTRELFRHNQSNLMHRKIATIHRFQFDFEFAERVTNYQSVFVRCNNNRM